MSKATTPDLTIVADNSDDAEHQIAEWVLKHTEVVRTLRNGFYVYEAHDPPTEVTADVTDSPIPDDFRACAGVGTDEPVEVYGVDRVLWSEHDEDGVLRQYATWQLELVGWIVRLIQGGAG